MKGPALRTHLLRSRTLRCLRPWVQAAVLLFCVVTLVGAGREGWPSMDLLLRLDPLAGLAGMLASRQVVTASLIGAAVMLAITFALGRVWCGWLCPLGTVLDWTPAHRPRPKEVDLAPGWRRAKHFALALIVVAALLGNLSFLFFDPVTLIYRTGAAAAWPALNALITGAEQALYPITPLQPVIDSFETWLRGSVFPFTQPLYGLGIAAALLFAGVVALNAVRARFWCRYLCPLGAFLGLVSKLALLRRTVGSSCIDCRRCARACPTGTIDPARRYESDPAECIMCLECAPMCSQSEQHFVWRRLLGGGEENRPAGRRTYDPTRRQFVASAAAAVTAVGLFGAEPASGREDAFLIRPPGARQPAFAAQCIRCGICLKACPTAGLQPSLTMAGWDGLWTPVLVARLGHCDYACNACGQACPTGAIPPLGLEEKRQAVIGHAYIDRSRCIPWADGQNCIVCEEMCPLPDKAIQLEEIEVWTPGGRAMVRRPYVLHDRCVGCGICENRCPLNGDAAIRVYAPSELGLSG